MTDTYETETEENTADLMAGKKITIDEIATELSAIELRLRQLARAAEVPDTPVELADTITSLRSWAAGIRTSSGQLRFLARIVAGDVPLALTFPTGDTWGAAARGTDRQDYGGPAIVPTQWQLHRLAEDSKRATEETTTYPQAMTGVGLGWESKAASARRQRERDTAVAAEVLTITCAKCGATDGEHCRTAKGWVADKAHAGRQREAEATVDARLGYLDANPVAVPDA